MSENKVRHLSHYGGEDDPYETIKVLRARLTPVEYVGALKFNIYKTMDRHRDKGGLEDLQTAYWYMNELMAYGHPDVSIAVENHGWSPLTREVISSLLPRGLRLCLDIPKLVRDGQIVEEDLALFRSNLDNVEVVHVHDLHPALGSHQVVGEGMIDFSPFLDILSDIPRNPQYVFEVRPRELAHESLVNFGRLLEERGIVL